MILRMVGWLVGSLVGLLIERRYHSHAFFWYIASEFFVLIS
jgi:hypothetical protein